MKFIRAIKKIPTFFTTLLLVCGMTGDLSAIESELPMLGDASSGIVSIQEEYEIGQSVLKSLRRSTQLLHDALIDEYVIKAIYRLVPSAPLQQKELSIVVINDPSLNAFAVPGGVVGVNTGLFLQAPTEQEFLSVLAHELAHLSQRHFARRVEQQQKTTPLAIAGMLTGLILAATTGSDAGIATIAGTQALSIQNQLKFSRENEQEADRMGLQILNDSGMEPRAMPQMFEKMLKESRLQGNRPPEYLSTHPLTESRVADTRNRAEQYPHSDYQDDLEYHLMRARIIATSAESPEKAVQRFTEERAKATQYSPDTMVLSYGLAIALIRQNQGKKALAILEDLLKNHAQRIAFVVSKAEALLATNQADTAVKWLQPHLKRNPGNVALMQTLAEAEMGTGNANVAISEFERLVRLRPANDYYWLRLSEAYGLSGRMVEVHRAKAEYHLMRGENREAAIQLREGLRKAGDASPVAEIMRQRLLEIKTED